MKPLKAAPAGPVSAAPGPSLRGPFNRAFLVGTLALCLFGALYLFWAARRESPIAFLPAHSGAHWLLYPAPAVGARQPALPVTALFQQSLVLTNPEDNANLAFCAFQKAGVTINGRAVPLPVSTADWKSVQTVAIGSFLHPGTNLLAVSVTNQLGPPALWLCVKTSRRVLGTDERWSVSRAGSDWQPARLATRAPLDRPGTELYTNAYAPAISWRLGGILTIVIAGAVLVVFLLERRTSKQARLTALAKYALPAVLILTLLLRVALFVHDTPALPRSTGFDAPAHEEYIRFILEKHDLPLPNDGWEMFQPPLYYAASALLLSVSGLSVSDADAALLLRAVNGFVGLLQCWVAFLCLRELLPGKFRPQALALLLIAFLPPTLYLSEYVTNEPLAGLFVTLAFYICLKSLRARTNSFLPSLGIGLCLGAALLTKVSSVLAVPLFPAALLLARVGRKEYGARKLLAEFAVMAVSCLAVCGWHYVRVWVHFGKPLVGNWEAGWWQDPGFRTASYYWGFGQVLTTPVFSSLYSFADGLYSTLWSDGLASGAARLVACPPWNYDWLRVACLLALPLSLLAALGVASVLIKFFRQLEPAWFLMLGVLVAYLFGVLYMSLRVPSYAQVKAFYAFPAFLPLAALFALGCDRLEQLHSKLHFVTWPLLVVWLVSVYTGFWISQTNPQTHLANGIAFADSQRDLEAFQELNKALEIDRVSTRSQGRLSSTAKAEAHSALAVVAERNGNLREAVAEYREALQARQDYEGTLNNLAWLLATTADDSLRDGPEAVRLAERACRLTHNDTTVYIGTLAAAYAEAGHFPDAIAAAQKAVDCARLRSEPELAERNRQLLELYRAGKAYHEPK